MLTEAMLIGGPGHGIWWPVSASPAIAYRSSIYYARRVALDGWRCTLPVYLWGPIASMKWPIAPGSVMPGGIAHGDLYVGAACRWCYGPARPYSILCGRTECSTYFASVASLDILTADDAKDWTEGAQEEI